MLDQPTTLRIEIPGDVEQQEVWDVEKRLNQVENVTAELQEPKDVMAITLLLIHYVPEVIAIASGIKAVRDLAQILYNFLHPVEKGKTSEQSKNKIVVVKKSVRIELYDLSLEEIEKVLVL